MGPAVSRAAAIKRPGRESSEGWLAGGRIRQGALHLHEHGLVSRVARRHSRRLQDAREYDQLRQAIRLGARTCSSAMPLNRRAVLILAVADEDVRAPSFQFLFHPLKKFFDCFINATLQGVA